MSRETFLEICNISKPFMKHEDHFSRKPIMFEKRVAVALYWLATGCSYLTVANVFGVHRSTACKFVLIFLDGTFELRNNYIKFPERDEDMLKAIDSFAGKSNFPFVMGAIDGTHVEINKPEGESAIDYLSRKQKYTIVNQAICNGNLAVDAGFPGSIHDSRMLEHSWIGKAVAEDTFLNSPTTYINGVEIAPYLLGHPAYALTGWLMKPYPYAWAPCICLNWLANEALSRCEEWFG